MNRFARLATDWLPRRYTELLLPLLALVLVAALWFNAAARIEAERERATHEARERAVAWSQRLAERAARLLDQADATVRLAAHLYERASVLDVPAMWNERLLPRSLASVLTLTDAAGLVVATTDGMPGADVRDREAFQVHALGRVPAGAPYLGGPVQPRVAPGRWRVPLSRAVRDDAGRFLGVAAALLAPEQLVAGLNAQELGKGYALAVVGDDGIYRAADLDGHVEFGARIEPAELDAAVRASRAAHPVRPDPLDGAARIQSYQRIPGHALWAGVGISERAALAPFEAWRADYHEQVAVWTALVALAAAVLTWQLARLHRSQQAAAEAHRDYEAASEASHDAFFLLRSVRDAQGVLVDFAVRDLNTRGAQLLGRPKAALVGATLGAALPGARASGFVDACIRVVAEHARLDHERPVAPEAGVAAAWVHYTVVAVGDGIAITVRDVSERHAARQQLERLALHDALTGLPNRVQFQSSLERAVGRARREGSAVAVLFIDLDGFKAVNDTLGHAAGDALLRATAARLVDCVRAGDTVSRLGGDEFTVIAEGVHLPQDAVALAERLLGDLSRPVEIDGQAVRVGASIGICMFPQDGATVGELLHNADAAMYRVKRQGKGGWRFFSREPAEAAG